ncbi:hypothetical protein ACEU2D_19795 [Brevibacillus laterosporus]|uniref:hypothetical protein n=1 Tax=Brevibacillus laterosporus TaxID=1465 RepID=UPI0035A67ECE
MSIKEQKLFFTRHDNYSIWEMLILLPQEYLDDLYKLCIRKMWTNQYPRHNDFPAFLYRIYLYDLSEEEECQTFLNAIEEKFKLIEKPKSDFNGLLYLYTGQSLDIQSAEHNLRALKENPHEHNINGYELEYFLSSKNIIDVRFSNSKLESYKENDIDQIVHTEIRVYLDKSIAIITNFSEYTHKDSEKQLFVRTILERVSSFRGEPQPVKLSDALLRKLLISSNTLPSKMKFDIDDIMNVGFHLKEPSKIEEAILNDEFRNIYDTGTLHFIRVKISESEEKYLHIDGLKGKIMSRTKNIDIIDIDLFISKIAPLLKYDYLNEDYKKKLCAMAQNKLDGPKSQKDIIANKIYKSITDKIYTLTKDETGVYTSLLTNIFIYCAKNGYFLDIASDQQELHNESLDFFSKIVGTNQHLILQLLSSILKLYYDNKDDLSYLIEVYNEQILAYQRMNVNASGL